MTDVVARLKAVLNYIDRGRLVIAPDCSLGPLSEKLAEAKLRVTCKAVSVVSKLIDNLMIPI